MTQTPSKRREKEGGEVTEATPRIFPRIVETPRTMYFARDSYNTGIEATRFYSYEFPESGTAFSGWVIRCGADSTDPIANKIDAKREMREMWLYRTSGRRGAIIAKAEGR